jgi:hypothetical protein
MSPARANAVGLLATFREPEPLTRAVEALRAEGYSRLDALTPFPVPKLPEALGLRPTRLPLAMLIGGLAGALAALALIYYSVEIDYPINVGGRPLNSWPAYLVLAFEGGILGAALTGFFGMLAANRLPTYYHPLFNARGFTFADDDRFFLFVESADPLFSSDVTGDRLSALGATAVETVKP